ncbi:MAG: cytochrome b/b6 domain-containing protein [Chloroflexota bacterium]
MKQKHLRLVAVGLIAAGLITIALGFSAQTAAAQSPLHPTFALLDADGEHVLETGNPVSTTNTCGQCHDTEFIASHNYHNDVGFSSLTEAGTTASGRSWDTSGGLFGKWDPITYRYLTPAGDHLADLSTEEWIQTYGLRHAGGGPADDAGVEINCFLCHLINPDNDSRIAALEASDFEWASTATLLDSEVVSISDGEYQWNEAAFDPQGEVLPAVIGIHDPTDDNCGLCHGTVHTEPETPLAISGCEDTGYTTSTTGQVITAQRIDDTGMNIQNKNELGFAWDVHIERRVECVDCHYSLNNPVYTSGSGSFSLEHLDYDPRRVELGEYIVQPMHDFARGESAQSTVSPETKGTIRRCEGCHNVENSHDWLPYIDTHMNAMLCESCHIPQIYNAATQQVDWTVVELDGTSQTACRGVEGDTGTINDLVTGYEPVLIQRQNLDGTLKLAPYNLITSWFWVHGEPERPVRLQDLEAVFLDGESYAADVVVFFDADGSGEIEAGELNLDTEEKAAFVAAKLEKLGLSSPRISAEVQPYSISHNVIEGQLATAECTACHSDESRVTQPIQLASYVPGDVIPVFVQDSNTLNHGDIYLEEDGSLYYQPDPQAEGMYVFGHDKVAWVDWFGAILFLGVLGGISTHGGIRVWYSIKRPQPKHKTKKIDIYTLYERIWHWLQTLSITILAFTGLIIHRPEMFGLFDFNGVVLVHNIVAGTLAVNAALALFYNLVSGDIQRFMPEPKGFFNQMMMQAKFYLGGIFKGEEHPFEKTRVKRLNVLQKITYLGILNVLLPLQGLTGILMWGVSRWPEYALKLGGLPFLAPFHTLVAWSFVSFIVAHVYLTTTGHTPMAGIKSMFVGWDEVEIHSGSHEEEE